MQVVQVFGSLENNNFDTKNNNNTTRKKSDAYGFILGWQMVEWCITARILRS